MPAAIKLSFLALLVLCGSAVGSAGADGKTPQSDYESASSQELRLVQSAACPPFGADVGCQTDPVSESPGVTAVLLGSANSSNDCQACI